MLTSVFPLLFLLAAALAGQVELGIEALCEADRAVYYATSLELREEGPSERAELLRQVEDLLAQYERHAPICSGRLREHEAIVLTFDGQLEEANRRVTEYLAGPGQHTSLRSRIRLGTHKAWSLTALGRTVEGARSYFDVASLASEATASEGSRALVEAAATSRVLGDFEGSEAYIASALRLIADSLDANPHLLERRGFALLSRSFLIEARLSRTEAGSTHDSLVAALHSSATQALETLPDEGQSAAFRAVTMMHLALSLAHSGQTSDALQLLDKAADRAETVIMWLPTALIDIHMMKSRVCEIANDLQCAVLEAERAQAAARAKNNGTRETLALERRGLLAERRGDWTQAETLYREAIRYREDERLRLGLQDWSLSSIESKQAPYRGLVRAQLAGGQAEDAFLTLDRTRARYLQDVRRHHRQRNTLTVEDRQRIDSLTHELGDARRAFRSSTSSADIARQTQRVSQLQTEIERLVPMPDSSADLTRVAPVQRVLRDEERTLVSYFLDPERSVAFVVRPDIVVSIELDVTPQAANRLLADVGSPWRSGSASDPVFSLRALHELYLRLIAPVLPYVQTERITIVPDGALATVPFSALVQSPSTDYEEAAYLVRDYAISTDLAAALVAAPEEHSDHTHEALLLGRSSFDRFTWNKATLDDLPDVDAELRAVRRHTRDVTLVNDEATEASFRQLAPSADVVHIASHAWVDPTFPLYSWIALAPADEDDGILHLYEVLSQPLHADMVVLSGCSTGSGRRQGGEGMIGLQYAVRASGARSSLATLWAVADGATAALMGAFYSALGDGKGKDDALRHAQLAYLSDARGLRASPFYWAAPILSGDPSSLQLSTGWLRHWWVFAIAPLLAAGLAWRLRLFSARD